MEEIISYKNIKRIITLEPFETVDIKVLCRKGFPIMEVVEYLEDIQGNSKETSRTVEVYANSLKVFYEWLEKEGYELENVTIVHLKQYLSYLKKQGLKEGTVRHYYSSAIRFIEWCIGPEDQQPLLNKKWGRTYARRGAVLKWITGYKEVSQLRDTLPKKTKTKPKFITTEDVKEIREWIRGTYEDDFEYPYRTMYLCIFDIFVGTGIRKGELLALTVDSLISRKESDKKGELKTRYYLDVKNSPESQDAELAKKIGLALKTGRREIPITNYLANSILRWKALRPVEAEHNLLFANLHPARRGKMFSQYALKHFFKYINEPNCGGGLNHHIHPHMLRHTYATELISKVPIDVVQEVLGHASIETTKIYAHMSSVVVREFLEGMWEESEMLGGGL